MWNSRKNLPSVKKKEHLDVSNFLFRSVQSKDLLIQSPSDRNFMKLKLLRIKT